MVVSRRKWVFLLAFFVGLVVLGRPLELTSGQAQAPNRPFTDLAPDQAYAEAIVDLADRGIVCGFDDGTFKPQAPVMRQQFAKMLAITFGFPVSQEDVCPFVDVGMGGADTFYPDKYIAVGASRGVFLGTSPTSFSPYANMTRLQMVSMVVRAIDSLAVGPLPSPKAGAGDTWGQSDPEHGVNARWAASEGLLAGLPLATLDPSGPATRGEVAQMLHNFTHDVRYYGAKGDGATNDWQAITDAMDAGAASGKPVFLPVGKYCIFDELVPPDGVTIQGAGPTSVIYLPEWPSHSQGFIFHKKNPNKVTIRDLKLVGAGYDQDQSGICLHGARDCTLENLQLEDLWYGMKLGDGYRQAQRWTISDIKATKCRMPMYIQDVEDSTFTRLSLQGMQVDAGFDHCIYMSEGSFRLTFTDVTLIGGGGYGLHLYSSSGGPSSDITFNNLTVDARTGRQPMCIAEGFSNITFNNLISRMSVDEVHMRLGGCTNITFDGLNASGGDAFIGTWDGDTAGRVTIKNGNYDGPVLVSPDPGEQAIVDLIVENVTLGSTGESSYPR